MPISPGPQTNAGTSAALFEAKTTDPHRSGKIVEATKGANAAAAANAFEKRTAEPGGIQH
jgi:hypothetical protein